MIGFVSKQASEGNISKVGELISVIIPVYNVEGFLDKCVESVCSQSHKKLEIILVDDGSTDGSGKLCDNWKEKDDRIVVIHKQNGGVSNARNAGMELARGDYFAFVDSDDYIAPDMYEKMLERIKADGSDFAVSAYRAIDEEGRPCKQLYDDIPDAVITVDEYVGMVNRNARIHCTLAVVWNKLYKRTTVEKHLFRVGVIHEDEFFLNDVIQCAKRISFMHEAFYYYMQRRNSTMHVEFDERRLAYYYALRDRIDVAKEMKLSEFSLGNVVRECINSGVGFWLYMSFVQERDKNITDKLYEDVIETKREYAKFGTVKEKVIWNLFDFCPRGLARIYSLYKRIKRG